MMPFPDLDSLSLAQLVAQTVVVRASGYLYDHQIRYPQWEAQNSVLQSWITDWQVGGVILLGASAPEIALRTRQLQSWAQVPLLIAADVEEGVGQRFTGATWFSPPMALHGLDPKYAEAMGRVTAQEALAIGINWLFAPIADVNNNPDNPVINVRAFGETPDEVIPLVQAFIRGAHQYPILTTAKHFPGHGDTSVDSHLHTPLLDRDRQGFAEVELPPFAAAISAGVDSIMSAHIFAPVLDPQNIATMSKKILTDLLRQEMQFQGLIVTDALIMGGIANRYTPEQVAVQALEAGADVLLMPSDPIATIQTICEAVESGVLSRDRIKAAVERIWQAKAKVVAVNNDTVPLIGELANLAVAEEIAKQSLTVHQPSPLQLDTENLPTNVILVDDIVTATEKLVTPHTAAIAIPTKLGCPRLILDAVSLAHLQIKNLPPVLVQIFSRGNPFRGSAELPKQIETVIRELVAADKLVALVIYGSPYNLDIILPLLPPDLPWVFSYGQQPIAQQVALQALGLGTNINQN